MLKSKVYMAAVAVMTMAGLLSVPSGAEGAWTKGGVYMGGRQVGGPMVISEDFGKRRSTASADATFIEHSHRGARDVPTPDKTGDATLQAMILETINKFRPFAYTDEGTGLNLPYNLYLPDGYNALKSKTYPLVVFIADGSVVGKGLDAPLRQGYGGVVWATAAEQAKRPCLVLVPEYPVIILDDHDGHTMTEYVPLTERLIRSVMTEYAVDEDRVYATGQSMGCMTLMVLAARHPKLFAAGLFVSGQWDVGELEGLKGQTFFYVTAEGDDKASAGQRQLMEKFEAEGVPFSRSFGWDARMSQEEFVAAVASAAAGGRRANFAQFRLDSVLPEGMASGVPEHMFSFDFVYRAGALREWLFTQRREGSANARTLD